MSVHVVQFELSGERTVLCEAAACPSACRLALLHAGLFSILALCLLLSLAYAATRVNALAWWESASVEQWGSFLGFANEGLWGVHELSHWTFDGSTSKAGDKLDENGRNNLKKNSDWACVRTPKINCGYAKEPSLWIIVWILNAMDSSCADVMCRCSEEPLDICTIPLKFKVWVAMRAFSCILRHTVTNFSWLGETAHAVGGFPLLKPWSL